MKNIKSYKKELFAVFAIGMVLLFVINNYTTQEAYDAISCTYNQNSCAAEGWDGICAQGVIDECCMDVDMCGGQVVDNPYECYHYYCTDSGKFCDAEYDEQGGTGKYICACSAVEDIR